MEESAPSARPSACAHRDTPTVTKGSDMVTLLMNAGLAVDLDILGETGAEGIGLFRTEFQFMVAEEMPRLEAQTALYEKVLEAADGMLVTFRTLDLGGDKLLPYMELEREDNPALGWRAIRMGLDRPALLRMQIRALIKAAQGPRAADHVPAGGQCGRVPRRPRLRRPGGVAWAPKRGRPENRPACDVGAMIEAPSLLLASRRVAADDRLRFGRHQ